MQPTVSIIMATRNRGHIVGRAIRSVVGQSYPRWELVIVNDDSADDTERVVLGFARIDPRIKYHRNTMRLGMARSHNRALERSSGKYIAVLDDDDYWAHKTKLEQQVAFLERNPAHVIVGGGMIVVDDKEQELYRYLKPQSDAAIRSVALFANPFAHSTVLYRKDVATKSRFYDLDFDGHAADRALFLRMGQHGRMHNFPQYLAYYTLGQQNSLLQHQRTQLKASYTYAKRHRAGYPYSLPAQGFNYLVYLYSYLPGGLRRALNHKLLRLKRGMFDNVT